MSEHTSGPWFVGMRTGRNANMIYARFGDDKMKDQAVAQVYGIWSNQDIDECQKCEGMGDAYLIAAAPELLAALKYARRFVNASEVDIAFIDAAIAKATAS